LIGRYHGNGLDQRLRNDLPVERIAVMKGKLEQLESMVPRIRQDAHH